mmetsp:Transcript_7917/g.11191  ORF Transcript_7917/g.11191 Transcript_7917/m.11191 type:complete len:128 (+) Transcript_7917:831-1214(+)
MVGAITTRTDATPQTTINVADQQWDESQGGPGRRPEHSTLGWTPNKQATINVANDSARAVESAQQKGIASRALAPYGGSWEARRDDGSGGPVVEEGRPGAGMFGRDGDSAQLVSSLIQHPFLRFESG